MILEGNQVVCIGQRNVCDVCSSNSTRSTLHTELGKPIYPVLSAHIT